MDREEAAGSEALLLTHCTKRKRARRGKAKEVYSGPIKNLFVMAERLGMSCFVLSAKYGLITCDEVIEPYDVYLGELEGERLEELKALVREQFRLIDKRWDLAVIALTKAYSALLPRPVKARRAVVIGYGNVEAEKVVVVKPRTLGQRYKLYRELGEVGSLEELLRLVEEGDRH